MDPKLPGPVGEGEDQETGLCRLLPGEEIKWQSPGTGLMGLIAYILKEVVNFKLSRI